MAADNSEFHIPDEDQYRRENQDLIVAELPDSGMKIPVYQVPPGKVMTMIEGTGMEDLVDEDPDPEELNEEELKKLEASAGQAGASMSEFFAEEVAPSIATERTNKDAFHWSDEDLANDPDVDDFDVTALTEDDLYGLMTQIMGSSPGEEEGEQLEQFPG